MCVSSVSLSGSLWVCHWSPGFEQLMFALFIDKIGIVFITLPCPQESGPF